LLCSILREDGRGSLISPAITHDSSARISFSGLEMRAALERA
jgi:hypothetical protein